MSPDELAAKLDSAEELCLLDVRDQGEYARGHLFLARCLSLSELEIRIERLVPRKSTLIVLCDKGAGDRSSRSRLERAASVLSSLGYSTIRRLAGRAEDWAACGMKIFEGIYVPSKAFGEMVEHADGTPSLGPEDLHSLLEERPDVPVFDCRPAGEFARMSLPGARNCPGGELLYRLSGLAQTPDIPVVVNCAGRTRSIIGAQTMIAAGFPNPVYALRNGTMGWELAGFEVEHGQQRPVPPPGEAELQTARRMAQDWRRASGVPVVTWQAVLRMRQENDRSTYLFDVRDLSELASGTPPGSVHAPAGQLVQCTDIYAGTLRARVVLYDDVGIRNTMAAYWLRRAGWQDVWVLDSCPALEPPTTSTKFTDLVPDAARVDAGTAATAFEGATLIDLSPSGVFLHGHAPGAWFALRHGLGDAMAEKALAGPVVLMAKDLDLACLAYRDLSPSWPDTVRVLFAEHARWPEIFGQMERGFSRSLHPPQDIWHTPSSPLGGGKTAMVEYLSWEVDLLHRAQSEPGATTQG